MKRLMIAMAVVFAGLAMLGFYKGWLRMATEATDHKATLSITVDKDKIHDVTEKAKDATEKAKDSAEDLGTELKQKTKKEARDLGRALEEAGSDTGQASGPGSGYAADRNRD
jgi:basic membrane lipoprotein Med (substrate-binding protein (PBP1-ABC) superfamily)